MKFNKLCLKNFRSFGNNYQELKLGSIGLTALIGKNGSGKTSLAEAIEYAIYGKVRGRKKKQTNKSTLANRHNKNLSVLLHYNDSIEILRCSQPDSISVTKNGIDASDNLKAEVIKMPEDLFANFISFNSKDFKDFLNLSKHDRDVLMDRLFNLRAFEEMQKYAEKLHVDNLKSLTDLQTSHDKYEHSAIRLIKKMEEVKIKRKDRNDEKLESLSIRMSELKPEYDKINKDIEEISKLKEVFKIKWQNLQTKAASARVEIKNIKDKLKLYDSDMCVTCGSKLDTPQHISTKEAYLLKMSRYETALKLGEQTIEKLKEDSIKQTSTETILFKKLAETIADVKNIKNQQIELSTIENIEDKDWSEEIAEMREKASDLKELLKKNTRLDEAYRCILAILDVDTNRKELLIDLVPKLNVEIFKNVQKVGMPFMLRFSQDLTCEVEELGMKIDEDTLSEGETACLNTACLLAFIKLSKISKYTNLMFLDEVFEKLDEDNVKTLLNMIRNYAKEENLEIFLVQQRQTNDECFDRIVKIEKKMSFSNIIQQ